MTPPNGYTKYSSSPSGTENFIGENGLTLTIYADNTAELWASIGFVELKVPRFSWPHPRFWMFERDILQALNAAKSERHLTPRPTYDDWRAANLPTLLAMVAWAEVKGWKP